MTAVHIAAKAGQLRALCGHPLAYDVAYTHAANVTRLRTIYDYLAPTTAWCPECLHTHEAAQ